MMRYLLVGIVVLIIFMLVFMPAGSHTFDAVFTEFTDVLFKVQPFVDRVKVGFSSLLVDQPLYNVIVFEDQFLIVEDVDRSFDLAHSLFAILPEYDVFYSTKYGDEASYIKPAGLGYKVYNVKGKQLEFLRTAIVGGASTYDEAYQKGIAFLAGGLSYEDFVSGGLS